MFNRATFPLTLAVTLALAAAVSAQTPAPQGAQPGRPTASVNSQPRVDVTNMPRPIDMHDSVWIEDLTMLEVRDLIRGGATTALVLTGGIEENGPYLTTGKHNHVLKATGESIARALGKTLVAPIVTLEPGNPLRPNLSPGTIVLSAATYKAVLTDMAHSLKSQGFTNVVLLGDSGGNLNPMKEVAQTVNAAWAGTGARVTSSPSTTTTPTSRRSRSANSASTRRWKGCTTTTTSRPSSRRSRPMPSACPNA